MPHRESLGSFTERVRRFSEMQATQDHYIDDPPRSNQHSVARLVNRFNESVRRFSEMQATQDHYIDDPHRHSTKWHDLDSANNTP